MLKLYHELAYLWPLLSPPEDYEPEAMAIISVIKSHFKPIENRKPKLVEMGAGGGHTLSHLANDFDLVAVDIADPMLVNCSLICPQAVTVLGDMRDVILPDPVDVVLIHDAVDYMQTPIDVKRTLTNAYQLLNPGGLLIVAPTYTTESFENNQSIRDEHEDQQVHVAFTSKVTQVADNPNQFVMKMIFDITEKGKTTQMADEHCCGLFSETDWQKWMTDAGFTVHQVNELADMPWHGYVGIK